MRLGLLVLEHSSSMVWYSSAVNVVGCFGFWMLAIKV